MIARPSLDLAVIGNSSIAALIDRHGAIVWGCWPRLDGEPIFSALIDGDDPQKGFFSIGFDDEASTDQRYVRNTAIVETILTDRDGASFRILDFVPRFRQHGRTYRPLNIVRVIEPIAGLPRIRIRMRPRGPADAAAPAIVGSSHVRYVTAAGTVRLTTDAPITHIAEETAFVLTRRMTLIVHSDETLPDSTDRIGHDFLERTRGHWLDWVRTLNVPFEWQEAVIRAAITLQLCSFEDTGAIVAALTTSIPESSGTERNWDYRYCWIRDAYFTVHALNRVGATPTMERFIAYVTDVIALERGPDLKPVYAVVPERPIDEYVAPTLAGYRGNGPVRIGNAAREQVQHDVYGSVILAAWQMFFDERLPEMGGPGLFALLEPLGTRALARALTPDAGIWEYRSRTKVHTHSAVMCWVACDRLARIAAKLGLGENGARWRAAADDLRGTILDRAWNEAGYFAGSLDGDELDASLLLLHELGIVEAADPRFVATVDAIAANLGHHGHLMRYVVPDDFGVPTVAFTICTFWYVDALAAIGRTDEARRIFEELLRLRNHVGLLSEDLDPQTGELWGNFPQTYSMAGMIVAAMRLSKGWEQPR
ncbi:glycoside hydrolase family 15 protein [Siculibacillus lacustris]|uniref:Glycoside hydrolase family 15 protein n=1 Tax=Siculibacillus lacustris TaxID=1549641 RepID=A0A4Q9VVS7_9HYPH|nr:glycoside hydrolase family 15 protein [Siculibacillus lacustris]TBW40372.1 glycoside hydrolase family 15 protein [Siculibacillus lacustris]